MIDSVLNVAYSCGDLFSEYMGISLYSLLTNNKDIGTIRVFVTDLGISEENKDKLRQIAGEFGREINFFKQNDDIVKEYIGAEIPDHYGNYATYGKLLASKLYPKDARRILFIDSDTIVEGSLKGLCELDMSNKVLAMVPGVDAFLYYKTDRDIIDRKNSYYNCGVVYMNVENWDRFNCIVSVREAAKQGHTAVKDQSLINAAIDNEYILTLPYKYNSSIDQFSKKGLWYYKNHVYPVASEQLEEAATSPIIIHYKGDVSRPWFKECISNKKERYLFYKQYTPFKDRTERSVFVDGKYAKSGSMKKMIMKLFFRFYNTWFLSFFMIIRHYSIYRKNEYIKTHKI